MTDAFEIGGVLISAPVKSGQIRYMGVKVESPVDDYGPMETIDYGHHEIHEGNMFHAEYLFAGVANNGNADILMTTGANECHAVFGLAAGGNVRAYLYETPDASGGTAVTAYNMKRNSSGTATAAVTQTPTVGGVGGTALVSRFVPGGNSPNSRIGGGTRTGNEWILKESTEYLIRVTNVSGSAVDISIALEWYEE